jgi:hypothetical protein
MIRVITIAFVTVQAQTFNYIRLLQRVFKGDEVDKDKLDLIVDNEREWRQYMIEKVDRIDRELSTFKVRVLGFAAFFGGASGLSVEYIKNFIIGG